MTAMNRANFAKVMGVHRSRVTDWCSQGMPVLPDGDVDSVDAAGWVHRHIDPTARLRTARQTARGATMQKAQEIAPRCCEHLTDPIDGAITASLQMLAEGVGASASVLAVHAGASCAVAHALGKAMGVLIRADVASLLDRLDVPPPPSCQSWDDAPLWAVERESQVDWPAMASQAGEAMDLPAWEQHTRDRFGCAPSAVVVAPGKKMTGRTKQPGKR